MTVVAPFSASFDFMGGGISTTLGPARLKIIQAEYEHEIVVAVFWAGDVTAQSLASGMPVRVTWGRPSTQRIFYGNVSHARRWNNTHADTLVERNAVQVFCVGASFPLNQEGTQVWHRYTSSQIVQEIANTFNLAADITPHPTVWASKQMAGLSYWKFGVKLAQQIGYTFLCNGVQLTFKPRETDPANVKALAAVYNYRADPDSLPIFNPTMGVNNPNGGQLRTRTVAGINPRTMSLVYSSVAGNPSKRTLGSTVEPPLFEQTEHFTVQSQEEADTKVKGAGISNQLYLTASATAVGNPLVSAGSLVYVQNANGSENGLWYVERVEHEMDVRTYQLNLSLGRDSRGASTAINPLPRVAPLPVARLAGMNWRA